MLSPKKIAENIRRLKRKQDEDIEKYGRTIIGVFPCEGDPDPVNSTFVYTIGNTLKGYPELFAVGIMSIGGILNALSVEMRRRAKPFEEGETYTFEGSTCPLAFVAAAESVKENYTTGATARFGIGGYRVLQVVLSDPAGLLPWQAGCAKPYCDVVVHRAKLLN